MERWSETTSLHTETRELCEDGENMGSRALIVERAGRGRVLPRPSRFNGRMLRPELRPIHEELVGKMPFEGRSAQQIREKMKGPRSTEAATARSRSSNI